MGITRHADRILHLAAERGVVRARDLADEGIPRATLSRLVASGRLAQVSRGLYALPNPSRSEQHQLAEIALRSPHGVFCLLTALRFHRLTTQSPHEVWLAIPNKGHPPRLDDLHRFRAWHLAIGQGAFRSPDVPGANSHSADARGSGRPARPASTIDRCPIPPGKGEEFT